MHTWQYNRMHRHTQAPLQGLCAQQRRKHPGRSHRLAVIFSRRSDRACFAADQTYSENKQSSLQSVTMGRSSTMKARWPQAALALVAPVLMIGFACLVHLPAPAEAFVPTGAFNPSVIQAPSSMSRMGSIWNKYTIPKVRAGARREASVPGVVGVSMLNNPGKIGEPMPNSFEEGREFLRDGRNLGVGQLVAVRRSDGR